MSAEPITMGFCSVAKSIIMGIMDYSTALKTCLSLLGFDSSSYSGHSFHHGAATSAASASCSNYELQLLG